MFDFTCKNCRKPFQDKSNRPRKFCSCACSNVANKGGVARPKTAQHIAKMTSAVMSSEKVGHKVEFVCDWCGKTFQAYAVQRPRPNKFCDRACSLAWQRAGGEPSADTDPYFGKRPPKPETGMTVILVDGEVKQV